MSEPIASLGPASLDALGIDLTQAIGLGVAGNFAGHLEQAGEASDFVDIAAVAGAPKGVFPFYVPQTSGEASRSVIHTFPVSNQTIAHPGDADGGPARLQIEPEIGLICKLTYGQPDHAGNIPVVGITPTHFGAHNDCSIRKEGAKKISEKKNWGAASKGLATDQCLEIDTFTAEGVFKNFRLACFLKRAGAVHEYGEDSAANSYGYMYDELMAWTIEQLNKQQDVGPLENIADWLRVAGYPAHALISIGATRYTDFGEKNFLRPGDESIVVVYDQNRFSQREVRAVASQGAAGPRAGLSVLRQVVVQA